MEEISGIDLGGEDLELNKCFLDFLQLSLKIFVDASKMFSEALGCVSERPKVHRKREVK